MLIVQKFHSIHEIDPEFIPSLELLLQEEVPSFNYLVEKHDTAPASDVFTYFLFFGPTQNTPIGFAQLCLRQLPGEKLISWQKKVFKFWDKDHEHWKELIWKVGDGHAGLFVFDSRYVRSGKEKVLELIREYELRDDIKAQEIHSLKGLQDFQSSWEVENKWSKDTFVLDPLIKSSKTYQDYLQQLNADVRRQIKHSWKSLHQQNEVELGDYPSPHEAPKTLPVSEEQLTSWEKAGAQILTFEKDLEVLGCLVVFKGRNGNIFFEPFPFEPEGNSLVPDELYTQYALLKFFEMSDARKCHLLKFSSKLAFEDKEDLKFFLDQGFQFRTITQSFASKLPQLTSPL